MEILINGRNSSWSEQSSVLIAAFVGSLFMLVAWAKGHQRHGLKGYPHEGVCHDGLARPRVEWLDAFVL